MMWVEPEKFQGNVLSPPKAISSEYTVADLEIQKGVFRYARSLWLTKQQHEHTHKFLNKGNKFNIFIVDVIRHSFPLS